MIILISRAVKRMDHKEKINALIIKLKSSIITIKNVLKELSMENNLFEVGLLLEYVDFIREYADKIKKIKLRSKSIDEDVYYDEIDEEEYKDIYIFLEELEQKVEQIKQERSS